MTSAYDTVLEHRLSQAELETFQLRRQVEQLTAQVQRLAQAPVTPLPAKRYQPPAERTTLHERRSYEFFAKLPPIRRVIDYRSHNTATDEALRIDGYSAAQISRACQRFSRLQFVSRKHWTGNRALFSVARQLFAQHSAITRDTSTRTWHWAIWPHMRRECCARIIEALSCQN